jgi:hypothetical protein
LYCFDQVFEGASEAIEPPDDDHITGTRDIKHAQKCWAIKALAAHFVGKGSGTLFLSHRVFLEGGGLFIATDANIAQLHLVISWLHIVGLIVQQLIAEDKRMNVDLQMAK